MQLRGDAETAEKQNDQIHRGLDAPLLTCHVVILEEERKDSPLQLLVLSANDGMSLSEGEYSSLESAST